MFSLDIRMYSKNIKMFSKFSMIFLKNFGGRRFFLKIGKNDADFERFFVKSQFQNVLFLKKHFFSPILPKCSHWWLKKVANYTAMLILLKDKKL